MANLNESLSVLRDQLAAIGQNTDGMEKVRDLVGEICSLIDSLPIGKIREMKDGFRSVSDEADKLSETLKNASDSSMDKLVEQMSKFKDEIKKANDGIEEVGDNIKNSASEAEKLATAMTSVSTATTSAASSTSTIATNTSGATKSVEEQAKGINVLQKGYEGLKTLGKQIWENWKEIDEVASKHGRTIGLDAEGIKAYRKEMFGAYKDLAVQYGMTNKELVALQQGYTKATDKARLLTRQATEDLAGASKIIGQENVDAIAEAMDNLGGSATSAAGAMANISLRARAQGLEATKAAKSMAEAMKMSQRYTFKEGVNGMAKMVAHAQSLKVSMQSIESAADKFSTIEGAIQTSAQLQVLGGDFQNSFANPMQMMGLALTDMNEFQDKLLGGFKNLSYFNEKTGRMDMSQLDKMRLQAAAKAAGMSYDDAFNAATQEGLQARIEQSMKSSGVYNQLDEQNRAWVKNSAQYNTETGKFEVQFEDKNGKMQTVAIDKLKNEEVELIKKRGTKEDALRDDVSAIRYAIERQSGYARETKSWNEMMGGTKTSIGNLGSGLIDWAVPKGMLGKMTMLGAGGAVGIAGLSSTLGLIGQLTDNAILEGLGKRRGLSSLATGSKNLAGKAVKGTKGFASKGLKLLGKMPKKGKVGLAIGAVAALTAGTALATQSNKGEGGNAEASKYDNVTAQEGTELGELQKQTSLLEKLVNGQSETLSKASASPTMDALGEVLTSSSMLSYGAIAGGKRLLTKPPKAMMNAFNSVDKSLGYKLSNNIGLEDNLGRSLTRDSKGVLRVAKGQAGAGRFAKAANPFGKLGKGVGPAMAIQMAADIGRGFTEEGSTLDKSLGVVSRSAEFASYGSMIPGIGTAIGAGIGAVYGAAEQFGQDVRDKADEMMEAGGFLNSTGGYLLRGVGTFLENIEGTFDGIGNAIGSVAKAAWKGGRKVLSFATFGLLGGETTSEANERREGANAALDQMVFERGKIGATSINDSQLMQKAALATISIHDLMVSRWNKEDKVDASDEAIEKHRKKIAKNGLWSEDAGDIFDDYGSSGPTTSIVGHAKGGIVGGGNDSSDSVFARLSHGEMVLNQEQQARLFAIANGASEVEARPTGEGTKISKKDFVSNLLFGGHKEPSVGPKSIDININGTLKLTGNGGSANFDVKELAKNKEFMDMMFRYITEQMDRKGQLGVGSNKNSSIATRGYGMESNVGMV